MLVNCRAIQQPDMTASVRIHDLIRPSAVTNSGAESDFTLCVGGECLLVAHVLHSHKSHF